MIQLSVSPPDSLYSPSTYFHFGQSDRIVCASQNFQNFIFMIPKVKQWFSTSECQALDDSKFTSEKYLKDSDNDDEEED
ncbi:hypothetical protein BC830DRAFT_1241356, partial [Chytriomyces sp. MP71]